MLDNAISTATLILQRNNCGAQWLCRYSVTLRLEGLLVRASTRAESLSCVLEQDTLSTSSTQKDWF